MIDLNKRVIFPNEVGGIAVLSPLNCGLTIEEIARKDVPAGTAYRIVELSDFPSDDSDFDRWTADFSEPDGHGIGPEAWFAEQETKK